MIKVLGNYVFEQFFSLSSIKYNKIGLQVWKV